MTRTIRLNTLLGVKLSCAQSRILNEGIWVTAGQLVSAAGTLLGVRLLTEFVSPSVFGSISLLMGFSLLGTSLFCNPLLQATTRFFPESFRENRIPQLRLAVSHSLRNSTLLLIALVLVGGGIYSFVQSVSVWAFIALAGLIALDISRGIETNLLAAARRQRPLAIWNAAEAWARPALAVLAVTVFGASAHAVLIGYVIASALGLAIFKGTATRDGVACSSAEAVSDSGLEKQLRQYAMPLMPLAIVSWVASLSDRYVIGGMLGLGQAGVYAAAVGLISRPFLMMGNILLNTLRPVYFEAVSVGNETLAHKTLRSWLLLMGGASAVLVAAATVFSRWLVTCLLAEEYRSSAELIPYFALGYAIINLSYIYNTVSLAYKRSWSVFISESTAAFGSIFIGIPMTWMWGLKGAAMALPLYAAFQLLSALWLSRRFRRKPAQQ